MRYPRILVLVVLLVAVRGVGADPLEGYEPYEAFAGTMRGLGDSEAVSVRSLGRTRGGREVWVATVGSGDVDTKPAVFIAGSTHASDLFAGELAVRMIRLLSSDDEAMMKLRERVTFYIVPRPSPDATEHAFVDPRTARTTNDRPRDDDNDGETDEDGPNDLNGDGWITMMRIAEPGGEWIEHPDDPRVMIKADRAGKNERGRWTLMGEGQDDDRDGEIDEDPPGGVAFDRNWSFAYPHFAAGAGPHAVSEPETGVLADFLFSRTNIAAVFAFSERDNLAHPWKPGKDGREKTHLQEDDAGDYGRVVEMYKKLREPKDAPASGDAAGRFVDWAYFHYGRWSFGARGWWVPGAPEEALEKGAGDGEGGGVATPQAGEGKEDDDKRGGDERNLLRWLEANGIDGFVDWQRIEHPDFRGREVEVGGFKPVVTSNPPAGELDALAQVHTDFVAELAKMLPRVSVVELRAEAIGGGVVRVEAVVVNDGDLATMPRMGAINRIPIPLNWTLDAGEGATLLRGERRGQIDRLESRGGQTKLTWLVRTDAKAVTLSVGSPAVGRVKASTS